MIDLIYQLGSYNCHQWVDRSFMYLTQPLPFCARCTGIYLGCLLGLVVYVLLIGKRSINMKIIALLLIVGIVPLAVDGGSQLLNWRLSNNDLRLATGLLFGVNITVASVGALLYYFNNIRNIPNKKALYHVVLMYILALNAYPILYTLSDISFNIISILLGIGCILFHIIILLSFGLYAITGIRSLFKGVK